MPSIINTKGRMLTDWDRTTSGGATKCLRSSTLKGKKMPMDLQQMMIITEIKMITMVLIIIIIIFFLNFILIYKLNIQIQISLIIGNLYSADLIIGISSLKKR